MKQLIATLLFTALSAETLHAQGRPMPLAELPAAAEVLATGNTVRGAVHGSYIYTNPASVFASGTTRGIDARFGFLSLNHRTQTLQTVTADWRVGKNAFFFGTRYWDMGSVDTFVGLNMQQTAHKKVTLDALRVDGGYARQLSDRLAFFAVTGYASERGVTTQTAWQNSLGIQYTDSATVASLPLHYTASAAAQNVGFVHYRHTTKMLSPRLSAGGSMALTLSTAHAITLYADAGYYPKVDAVKASTDIGAGIRYTLLQRYSLAAGHHAGDNDNYWTAGASAAVGRFTIDAAAQFPHSQEQGKLYLVGVRFNW